AHTGPNADFESWLRSSERRQIQAPFATSELVKLNVSDHGDVLRKGTPEAVTVPDGVSLRDGPVRGTKALRFEQEAKVTLPNVPDIDTDKPFTIATWVQIP